MTGWGRGVLLLVLGWTAGLALQLQQAALWPLPAYGGLLAAGAVCFLAAAWLQRRAVLLLALGLGLAAFGSTGLRAAARLAQVLSPALEGAELSVQGRVVGLPQVDANGLRFVLQVSGVQAAGGQPMPLDSFPAQLWLSWPVPGSPDELAGGTAGAPAALRAGEAWRLPVKLRRPHGAMNPGGFDAELWMFEQGLGAVGAVRAPRPGMAQRLDGPRWWQPVEVLDTLRQRWRDRILLGTADPAATGLLAALAVGDQSAIDGKGWALYRQTGISHLISISGLHITLFAAMAGLLVGAGWRRSVRLRHWLPAPVAARWGGLVFATLYALMAGWGVPAQRTVCMLALAVVLRSFGPPWPALLLCALTGALVTLLDPWAMLQPGFWLSFAAVALLMMADAAEPAVLPEPANWWARLLLVLRRAARAQWVITVGLAPLTLVLFQQISLVGLPANWVAVPLVTFVITPLALLGTLWPGFWTLAGWLLQPLLAWLQWLASWPAASWGVPESTALVMAFGLLGGLLLALPLPWRLRLLGVPLALPLLWPAVPRPPVGEFELVAADVGQGSAVVIRTAHHTLVHDTGPRFSVDSDAGQRVLLPLLQALGDTQLDTLVLSHRDLDHVGGAPALLARWPQVRLLSSLEAGHPLLAQAVHHETCAAGQQWDWDGVHFQMLFPAPGAQLVGVKPNTVSCVLKVSDAAGRSALLTGDLEAAQEHMLVAQSPELLASTVLLVPHHGSHTSSSEEFLRAVGPKVAVVQVGYRSRFGHPHPQVLARYQALRVPVVRSDHCGAWRWSANGATCTRDVQKRHWHWQGPAASGSVLPAAGAVVATDSPAGEHE
ncbi:DNA internalization-related competence protein ComEC/Rec2 [Ideonella azotifigens]|uniref:DNA internalization-related competence protein ComEC/Rec2 n=3 Tax=Ideonella azotifigens TaxID=513160 RepID=A0ABP3VQQ2_9BURK|nr:DNA internalization-related competence protein ComEC/Rec2 [Ideonella azotifigens]MCD2343724.1 DNA internalization-related competence protein ComEC/Rec2 [Ideonella azotifigens]